MSLVFCYFAAYSTNSAIFFFIYESILDLVIIIGSCSINVALWQIHYRLQRIVIAAKKQLIEIQQSNSNTIIVEEGNLSSKELTSIRSKIKQRLNKTQKKFQFVQFDIQELKQQQSRRTTYDSIASKFRQFDKQLSACTMETIKRTITNEQSAEMAINKISAGQRRVSGILLLTLFVCLISSMVKMYESYILCLLLIFIHSV